MSELSWEQGLISSAKNFARARSGKTSISFHRRTLSVLRTAPGCDLFTQGGDSKLPDFAVQCAMPFFRKGPWCSHLALETIHPGQGTVESGPLHFFERCARVLEQMNAVAN